MKRNKSTEKVVIDVRRPDEFAKGHAKKSINIPLNEIPERLDEIKKLKAPLIVVCGVFSNVFGGADINFELNNNVYLKPWGYLVFERIEMLSKDTEVFIKEI